MAVNLDITLESGETSQSRKDQLRETLYSPLIEALITILIILNAIILAALTYKFDPNNGGHELIEALVRADRFIVGIFVAEMVLKLFAGGRNFFKSGWNIFDLLVIGVSLFGSVYPLTVLRSFRVLRTLRLVTRVPSMKIVVESFLRALPGIGSVLTVLLIIMFVFSVIGTRMFGEISPVMFGTFHDSIFTLFTVLTLEGWPDVARDVMDKSPNAWMFFVSFIAINSFAVLNLIIAVIINAMHKEYDAHAEEEREDILEEVKALRQDINQLLKK